MLTSELMQKIRRIEIRTRKLVNDSFAGEYHSIFKGRGMEISEVREYQYGDDIRNIDWNVTARFNHPYIKIFEEERELTVMLLIDVSGSNEYGSRGQFKEDQMTEIAAVMAFSAINNNDKVGVIFFSDKVEKFIPPKKGRSHILRIIRELIDFRPESQKTDVAEALRYLTNAIKKRCTAFVISDFLDTGFDEALRIAGNKHDVVALRVYDESETSLPNIGLVKIFNKEKGKHSWIDTASAQARSSYNEWWRKHKIYLDEMFRRSGTDYASISTNQDYVKPLVNLFKIRESRM